MADSKKYNGSQWEHSLRKIGTATETIHSGDTIYANGQPITTYTLKGNTTQSGTPTPSNPVEVNGVGVRTENIFNGNAFFNSITSVSGNGTLTYSDNTYTLTSVDSASTYTIPSVTGNYYSMPVKPNTTYTLIFTNTNGQIFLFENAVYSQSIGSTAARRTFTTRSDTTFLSMALYIRNNMPIGTVATFSNIMLLEGNVNPSEYIPYGYKIPILTAQGSAVNYLGSVQSNRQIKKIILTGDEAWLAENTDNFYNNTILDDAKRLMLVLCTHQSSVYKSYVAGIENIWISASGRLNFTTTAINHDVNAFKSYLQQQYANGTPVTVWYVLQTAETAAVNEPLMKIGDYTDTLSNATAIPTTDGANSITVDTTVQPSEFTATWTGWHDSSVKEWDGSDWQ